jgi:PAS domain S-box-containing protein
MSTAEGAETLPGAAALDERRREPKSPVAARRSFAFESAFIVFAGGILPLGLAAAAHHSLGGQQFINNPLHVFCEVGGSSIAFSVAMLLLLRVRHEKTAHHLVWLAGGLTCMGFLDAAHALAPFGSSWSWLRHLATLMGGVFFCLTCVRPPRLIWSKLRCFTAGTAGLSFLIVLLVYFWPHILPSPWVGEHYSIAAKVANMVGGLGFLVAVICFLFRHRQTPEREDLLLASQAMLFATAGFLFGFSHVWGADWWLWHGLRLLAYAVAAGAAYNVVLRMYKTIAGEAAVLEERIQTVTREVRTTEERFRAVADNIPPLAWMTDETGYILWYNQRWYDYTGTTLEQMRGWGWEKVHHPDHGKRVTEGWKRSLASGEPWQDIFPLRNKNGGYRWFLSRAVPIRDKTGKITQWFGSNTDITDLRATEQALHEAQAELRKHAEQLEQTVAERTARLSETVQELEAFSYSIAHDMRAPLRGMQGFANVLREEYKGQLDDRALDYINRIVGSAARLDLLITDILNYSRIVRQDLKIEPVDVEKLLLEIIHSYPNLQPPKADIRICASLPGLWGNAAALTQVFSNLLGNAVKFVPAGTVPRVEIKVEREKEWARLWFEDNGIGIEKKAQERIFHMFQRLNRQDLYEGTGIGLAIVRKAMERMGGRVGVESEPGKGSRFWIELKRAPKP